MTRRRFVIFAHWSTAFLLAVLLVEGPSASNWLVFAFAGITTLWFSGYVIGRGPLGKPGPKLTGNLRPLHRLQHHALYIATATAAYFTVTALASEATGSALKVLLFVGLLHGMFHTWRHTALFDGALRTITPRLVHKVL